MAAEFSPAIFYASLFLFALGTVLPPVLLLPKKWRHRLVWVIPGAGLVITFHFILNRQWIAAIRWLLLTGILALLAFFGSFVQSVITRVLEQIKQRLEKLEQPFADWIVSKLWASTSQFQREYYQSLIYLCRDYQTQGLDKDRVLKLQACFVPLKIVAKEAVQVNTRIIPPVLGAANNPREKQIWDFLAAMVEEPAFRRMAVLGAPGSGKTTLLRHLTLIYAHKQERQHHAKAPKLIPVLLYLRDVRQEIVNNQPSIAELITKQVKQQRKIQPLDPPDNWFAQKLRDNKCLVMLDGLDEVADETERLRVSNWVDEQMR